MFCYALCVTLTTILQVLLSHVLHLQLFIIHQASSFTVTFPPLRVATSIPLDNHHVFPLVVKKYTGIYKQNSCTQKCGYYYGTTTSRMTASDTTQTEKNYQATIAPVDERMAVDDNNNNNNKVPSFAKIAFSHVHMYVDTIDDLKEYQNLEMQLNTFTSTTTQINEKYLTTDEIMKQQQIWNNIIMSNNNTKLLSQQQQQSSVPFVSQDRDIIKQLMVGFGFRIVGTKDTPNTHNSNSDTLMGTTTTTMLVTSRDPNGVQYLITSLHNNTQTCFEKAKQSENDELSSSQFVFCPSKVARFLNSHSRRQGIGVLAFIVENVRSIKARYELMHPLLVSDYYETESCKILEVFAFYKNPEDPDEGTTLRFIESNAGFATERDTCDLLGLDKVEPIFIDDTSQAAYCDHWVSNVHDRTGFLDTLYDTLGFTPKVDFNAGVVAAGEAQIESTVTGNTATTSIVAASIVDTSNTSNEITGERIVSERDKRATILKDQNQVYLPINNALSEVGHVHGFLNELGQGIQHIASRVENLVDFVQRCNTYRTITNEGFTFLRIPRSYYGVLTEQYLLDAGIGTEQNPLSKECISEMISCLRRSGHLSKDGAVDLNLSRDEIHHTLENTISDESNKMEYSSNKDFILDIIMRSRYSNLYALLKDQITETQYIGIVRNQILVDIQGNDLLYQIFTSNILQRKAGEEAPFLEFIQRVCSSKGSIKPGCGGFGIRNFLTLFLSIEVSKAMQEVTDATDDGDIERQKYAQSMVDCFTMQLNESNPILTKISDAMTAEGEFAEKMSTCLANNKLMDAAKWEEMKNNAASIKLTGNAELMECSLRYKNRMRKIRETRRDAIAIQ